MFDIRDYYTDSVSSRALENGPHTDNIEQDISTDIDKILKSRFDSLYIRDKFKHHSMGIEILYPRVAYPGNKSLLKGPDQMRNLLSLYPHKSDYENIDKIVLRPLHVEVGDIELMALYLRKKRILVLYLHHPHVYALNKSTFSEYSEFIFHDIIETAPSGGTDCLRKTKKLDVFIPPLWYIISMISASNDNKIDKFFIRKLLNENGEISRHLDEISFFYTRHGY